MRIVDIRELSVPLEGNIANAVVSFAEHDVSLVAVVTDAVRYGKPVIGYAFDSIGRFAQGGILRDRMIPRLKAAAPGALLDEGGSRFDVAKVFARIMRDEKPGTAIAQQRPVRLNSPSGTSTRNFQTSRLT
jgi:D(-)-tartrate dehydratase